jgi:hypothetical protein
VEQNLTFDGNKLTVIGTASVTNFIMTGGSPATNEILTAIDNTGAAIWSTPASVLANANGVTGSGTLNYFTYWKSSNNLSATSSLLFLNDGVQLFNNANYISTKTSTGLSTRSFGLNVSNNLYIGSVDQSITGILFNNNGNNQMYILANGNVGINTMSPTSKLHVRSSLTNSDVVRVDGVSGELFTITDNLVGSLFSVNDISGIPVFEAFSDNTINLGDYQSPALFTSTKSIKGPSLTNQVIYQVSNSLYSCVFFDYNVTSGQKTRTGTIMVVWNSTNVEFTETGTMDLGGDTSGISLTVDISGTNIRLLSTTGATDTWTIKVIVRAI